MSDYETAVARAREIGQEHGETAARVCGYTDMRTFGGQWHTPESLRELCDRFVYGIDTGDWKLPNGQEHYPLPTPDLSGEWADGYTPRQLLHDCGGNDGDASFWDGLVSDLCDAYEEGFSEAVEATVRVACEEVTQ